MTLLVAALAVALAVATWPVRPHPDRRLRELLAAPAPRGRSRPQRPVRRPLLLMAAIGLAATVAVGAPLWLPGLLAGAGLVSVRRRARRDRSFAELPLVIDLFASCLSAGAAPAAALAAAAAAAGPDLRGEVLGVARELGEGASPEEAWAGWLADPDRAGVARTCVRTTVTGAAAAAEVGRAAARLRAKRRAAAQHRSARAAVWVVLPLGLCFLPAFVLVGVVPLAVSLVAGLR
jgi:Flp pilus assembly protein TadB